MKWFVMLATIAVLAEPVGAANPKLSLAENATVRIPVGATGGEVPVLMKAESLSAESAAAMDPVDLKDLGGLAAGGATVKFDKPVEVDRGATSRAWLWTAKVTNLPLNSTQKRFARLTFGKLEQYVEYTVTNLPPGTFTWSVAPPASPWIVQHGFFDSRVTTTIVVTTGDWPATNLRLAQATLRDSLAISEVGLGDLELCESPTGRCATLSVNARETRTFYLRLKPGTRRHGKYSGAVSFAVNERPELQTVNVTLHASSFVAKSGGGILLAVGIWLAWWVSVWARARLLRLEALRPVAALRESVATLRDELEGAPNIPDVNSGNTAASLAAIEQSLTTEALDTANLLPPEVPRPLGGAGDTSANLRQHLTTQGDRVGGLTVVIRDGMRKLWNAWDPALPNNRQEPIKRALKALDELGRTVTTRTAAEQGVQNVLQEYQAERAALGIAADAALLQVAPPTVQQLSWQIARLYRLVWLAWGGLTFAAGLAVLVVTNAGFGAPLDYLFCLFWGFGLPTAVDRLQQIGPGGVASSIGVVLPRVNP